MHKNPNDRIKLPQIKAHPWFKLYKVSFNETSPELTQRKSNLITDSMILEGEDPFEDFMNRRLNNSNSSDGKSPEEKNESYNHISEFQGAINNGNQNNTTGSNQTSLSFKKQNRFSDMSIENSNGNFAELEIIPEEKGVTIR